MSQGGDGIAREQLLKNNSGIIVNTAKKFCRNNQEDFLDYCQVGSLAMLRSIDMYAQGRGAKWSTYAMTCVKNAILKEYIKSEVERVKNVNLEPNIEYGSYCDKCVDSWDLLDQMDSYQSRQIFKMYFMEGNSLREIGRRLNFSHEKIRKVLKINIKRIKDNELIAKERLDK